jgi:hypothetical protein
METKWLREDQNFKLRFGSENNNWDTVQLADTVDTDALHDGVYLSEDANGKFVIAPSGAKVAFPMLELKFQYDNEAIDGVTISRGNVTAYTKHFDGTPSVGDKMKIGATPGKLAVLDTAGGDTEDMAVAEVLSVNAEDIEIQKLY